MKKFFNLFTDIRYFFYYSFDLALIFVAIIIKIISLDSYKIIPKDKNKKSTIIICNGPSLSKDIDWIVENREKLDISAVHFFANSEYFFKVKPRYFFLADPLFWVKDINKDFKETNSELFRNFEKVNWKMDIICPSKGYLPIKKRIKNKFIKVEKIRHWSIDFKSRFITILSLRLNLTTPFFSTVAVMALWHAMLRSRKKIYIYGADFTNFKEFSINQISNEIVNNNFSHFYKNSKAENNTLSKYKNRNVLFNTILYKCWISFEQIYLLSRLAKIKKIEILNSSTDSYIDCFRRENLRDKL